MTSCWSGCGGGRWWVARRTRIGRRRTHPSAAPRGDDRQGGWSPSSTAARVAALLQGKAPATSILQRPVHQELVAVVVLQAELNDPRGLPRPNHGASIRCSANMAASSSYSRRARVPWEVPLPRSHATEPTVLPPRAAPSPRTPRRSDGWPRLGQHEANVARFSLSSMARSWLAPRPLTSRLI